MLMHPELKSEGGSKCHVRSMAVCAEKSTSLSLSLVVFHRSNKDGAKGAHPSRHGNDGAPVRPSCRVPETSTSIVSKPAPVAATIQRNRGRDPERGL